jgi:hypothetical protein
LFCFVLFAFLAPAFSIDWCFLTSCDKVVPHDTYAPSFQDCWNVFLLETYVYTSGCPWPSDTAKSPGFFKPRATHKGAKQPFFFSFFLKILWRIFVEKSPMKTYVVKRVFIIIIIIYVFFVFILCLLSLLYFCLFKKRSKYVALDFSADFLFFIFYFVSSFLLI